MMWAEDVSLKAAVFCSFHRYQRRQRKQSPNESFAEKCHERVATILSSFSLSSIAPSGRMIPRYPWESVMLPIAEWMGVDAMDRSTVFPNLHHFNSSLLLSTSALFST